MTALPYTHAGGLVYRYVADGGLQVLLARASTPPHEWILPKGHIERGETPAQTAVREVSEETGIEATVTRELGESSFVGPTGEQVRVVFFLMQYQRSGQKSEPREIRWCTIDEARELTSFESIAQLLQAAETALMRGKR